MSITNLHLYVYIHVWVRMVYEFVIYFDSLQSQSKHNEREILNSVKVHIHIY